jgi:hypothetical protein
MRKFLKPFNIHFLRFTHERPPEMTSTVPDRDSFWSRTP